MEIPARPGGRFRPAQVLVISFVMVILLGTFLLALPAASANDEFTSLVDAAFTATSAVCVTGLVVADTATIWSPLGQVIIMLLIQIGGLGIMTTGTVFAIITGRRVGLKERLVLHQTYGKAGLSGMVRLVRMLLLTTLALQGVGAAYMTARFAQDMPWGRAFYFGVFHSISAFCNAGFDLFGDSLVRYGSDVSVNLIFGVLIILGGLGFPVLVEIMHWVRWRSRVSLHSLIVLYSTGVLLFVGAATVFLFEYANPATLGQLSVTGKFLSSIFHSVTPRTAGFNTLPVDQLMPTTLLVTMMFMFIGASPGGTAGGVKTTTFAALAAAVKGALTGQRDIVLFKRRLGDDILLKSLAIIFLGLLLVFITTAILLHTEGREFLPTLFEAFSAFGTVGLSMGMTGDLSSPGKIIIMLAMFAGRVGPLTVFLAIATRPKRASSYRRLEEKIMVG